MFKLLVVLALPFRIRFRSIGRLTRNSNMLLWILITVLIVTGWGGVIGLSFDYVYEQCRASNVQLALDNRQGPPQDCK